jgi:hypothetical protein
MRALHLRQILYFFFLSISYPMRVGLEHFGQMSITLAIEIGRGTSMMPPFGNS